MNHPLHLRFKFFALAPQIYVTDATGAEVCYVKQQLFKLREAIKVYTNATEGTLLAEIKADKIIDFSATYTFTDAQGRPFGAVRRTGMRSLWRAHYEIIENGVHTFTIREGNPWTKFWDGVIGQVPLLDLLSGYLLHPRYDVLNREGRTSFTLHKRPAFLEGKFELIKSGEAASDVTVLMALLTMTLLERRRG